MAENDSREKNPELVSYTSDVIAAHSEWMPRVKKNVKQWQKKVAQDSPEDRKSLKQMRENISVLMAIMNQLMSNKLLAFMSEYGFLHKGPSVAHDILIKSAEQISDVPGIRSLLNSIKGMYDLSDLSGENNLRSVDLVDTISHECFGEIIKFSHAHEEAEKNMGEWIERMEKFAADVEKTQEDLETLSTLHQKIRKSLDSTLHTLDRKLNELTLIPKETSSTQTKSTIQMISKIRKALSMSRDEKAISEDEAQSEVEDRKALTKSLKSLLESLESFIDPVEKSSKQVMLAHSLKKLRFQTKAWLDIAELENEQTSFNGFKFILIVLRLTISSDGKKLIAFFSESYSALLEEIVKKRSYFKDPAFSHEVSKFLFQLSSLRLLLAPISNLKFVALIDNVLCLMFAISIDERHSPEDNISVARFADVVSDFGLLYLEHPNPIQVNTDNNGAMESSPGDKQDDKGGSQESSLGVKQDEKCGSQESSPKVPDGQNKDSGRSNPWERSTIIFFLSIFLLSLIITVPLYVIREWKKSGKEIDLSHIGSAVNTMHSLTSNGISLHVENANSIHNITRDFYNLNGIGLEAGEKLSKSEHHLLKLLDVYDSKSIYIANTDGLFLGVYRKKSGDVIVSKIENSSTRCLETKVYSSSSPFVNIECNYALSKDDWYLIGTSGVSISHTYASSFPGSDESDSTISVFTFMEGLLIGVDIPLYLLDNSFYTNLGDSPIVVHQALFNRWDKLIAFNSKEIGEVLRLLSFSQINQYSPFLSNCQPFFSENAFKQGNHVSAEYLVSARTLKLNGVIYKLFIGVELRKFESVRERIELFSSFLFCVSTIYGIYLIYIQDGQHPILKIFKRFSRSKFSKATNQIQMPNRDSVDDVPVDSEIKVTSESPASEKIVKEVEEDNHSVYLTVFFKWVLFAIALFVIWFSWGQYHYDTVQWKFAKFSTILESNLANVYVRKAKRSSEVALEIAANAYQIGVFNSSGSDTQQMFIRDNIFLTILKHVDRNVPSELLGSIFVIFPNSVVAGVSRNPSQDNPYSLIAIDSFSSGMWSIYGTSTFSPGSEFVLRNSSNILESRSFYRPWLEKWYMDLISKTQDFPVSKWTRIQELISGSAGYRHLLSVSSIANPGAPVVFVAEFPEDSFKKLFSYRPDDTSRISFLVDSDASLVFSSQFGSELATKQLLITGPESTDNPIQKASQRFLENYQDFPDIILDSLFLTRPTMEPLTSITSIELDSESEYTWFHFFLLDYVSDETYRLFREAYVKTLLLLIVCVFLVMVSSSFLHSFLLKAHKKMDVEKSREGKIEDSNDEPKSKDTKVLDFDKKLFEKVSPVVRTITIQNYFEKCNQKQAEQKPVQSEKLKEFSISQAINIYRDLKQGRDLYASSIFEKNKKDIIAVFLKLRRNSGFRSAAFIIMMLHYCLSFLKPSREELKQHGTPLWLLIFEGFCIVLEFFWLVVRLTPLFLIHETQKERSKLKSLKSWRNHGIFGVFLFALLLADWILIICLQWSIEFYVPIRVCLIPLFHPPTLRVCLGFFRAIRGSFHALMLYALVIFIVGELGLLLFSSENALTESLSVNSNFQDIFRSCIATFIFISSGENYSDVVYPAYERNPFFVVFFIIVVFVGNVILLAIVIDGFSSGFKDELSKESRKTDQDKRMALVAAFVLIDFDGSECIEPEEMEKFFGQCGQGIEKNLSKNLSGLSERSVNITFFLNKFEDFILYSKKTVDIQSKYRNFLLDHVLMESWFRFMTRLLLYIAMILIAFYSVIDANDLEIVLRFLIPAFIVEISLRVYAFGFHHVTLTYPLS